jgi:hypothetical protein
LSPNARKIRRILKLESLRARSSACSTLSEKSKHKER